MHKINCTQPEPYTINIGYGLIESDYFYTNIAQLGTAALIITDSNIANIYGKRLIAALNKDITTYKFVIPAGEQHKNRTTITQLENFMQQCNLNKSSVVIALGGGVITDIAGFVASTYMRGIKCVYVPTTLIAMTDAAIGGKNGINTQYGKNQIGTITSPHSVYVDPSLLQTQTTQQWQDGWVETLKHGLLAGLAEFQQFFAAYSKYQDASLHEQELLTVITQSIQIKVGIVEQDAHEKGQRNILNIGHTLGHALEKCCNYTISHGQAVIIGIITEAYIATQLHIMATTTFFDIKDKLLTLTGKIPYNISYIDFVRALQYDKKNICSNNIVFSLLRDYGIPEHKNSYKTIISSKHIKLAYEFISNNFITKNIAI